jgi:hypothetical protein
MDEGMTGNASFLSADALFGNHMVPSKLDRRTVNLKKGGML